MKPILTGLLLAITLSASAQKVRFTDKTNIWNTVIVDGDGNVGSVSYTYDSTDVFIDGNWYQYLRAGGNWLYLTGCGPWISGGASEYVREDTMAQKVYFFSVTDSAEHLLYDYTMRVGDSIHYYMYGTTYTDTVISMDSVLYNGYYYKIFNMQSGGSWRSYTVLEGVGCTNSPLLMTYWGGCFEGGQSLVCFYEDGIRPALHAPLGCYAYYSLCPAFEGGSSFDNTGICGSVTSVYHPQIRNLPVTITPNPANDHIDITSDHQFPANTFITVYDMSGRCVFRSQAEQQSALTINTTEWINGLYIIIVQDNSGLVKKEKIVMQQ